jgi:hypothetical protein
MKALLGCAVLGLTLLAGTACGGAEPTCEAAGAKLLGTIAAGDKTTTNGLEFLSGKTLESKDAKGTYIVAVTTKSGDGNERVGVWTTSNLSGEGAVYAVDAVAKETTSFGDSAQADPAINAGDAVVSDVRACL